MKNLSFKPIACLLAFWGVFFQVQFSTAQTLEKTDANGFKYKIVPADPMQTRLYTLPNGLTVYLSVNKNEPRAQIAIAVRAGSKHDPKENTGLAHYLEHMLFKGTERMATLDIAKEKAELDKIENLYEKYNKTRNEAERKNIYRQIDSISNIAAKYCVTQEFDKLSALMGGRGLNAFTSFEQTVYINNLPSNQLERWIKIEGERFNKPVMRLFHTELEAVYEEKNISLDDENDQVSDSLFAGLFRNHTYGTQTTIGYIEHLKNPSLRAIQNYYNTYYVPNNMAVCLAGDFDPDQMIKLIDQNFGWMKPQPIPEFTFQPEKPMNKPHRVTITGQESESVNIAYRTPGANHPDADVVEVIDYLLANSASGLIDINLVQKQLVLEAASYAYALQDYSVHFLEGKPKEGQSLQEVEMLLTEQLEKIKRGEFDEQTLAAIVLNKEIEKTKELQNNMSRTMRMVFAYTQFADWEKRVKTLERQSKLTKKQIMEAAQKYYLPANVVVVYKKQGVKPELPKIEKPQITPVPVNRDTLSTYAREIMNMGVKPVQPVFPDFQKEIRQSSLQNGSPFHYLANTEDQLFTLTYRFDFGSAENKQLAFALQMLKFIGAGKLSAEALQKRLYQLGAGYDVEVRPHQIIVRLEGVDKHFAESQLLLETILNQPVIEDAALKKFVERELKQREDQKADKDQIFYALQQFALHGAHNEVTNRLSAAELKALTVEQVTEWIKTLNRYPHRVSYFGSLPENKAQTLLNLQHKLVGERLSLPLPKDFAWNTPKDNAVYFVDYEMVQAELAWLIPKDLFSSKKLYLNRLHNTYFGSDIVFQDIRESKALAYRAYARVVEPAEPTDPVYAFLYIGTQADKLQDALPAMDALRKNMPLAPQTFESAVQTMRQSVANQRIRRQMLLDEFEKTNRLRLSEPISKIVYQSIDGVNLEDLKRYHDENLSKPKYSLIVLGSSKRVDLKALEKFGKVRVLTIDQLF